MKTPIHILHLEDDPNDAALVQATLKTGGLSVAISCVQTKADFVAALERGGIDLILSDFTLPVFDGAAATEIVQARWPAIPFIFVSGTLGEEQAIDSLKRGATDYVLKQRLTRLVPAVRRAMQEVELRAERQQLKEQFIEAQKMEVVGQLAGGVAHDFNNILAVIIGYSDMLAAELDANSPLRNHVAEIQHASERAVGLTRQLLVFSRKQVVHHVVLDLNDVVQDLEKMLRRLVDENIEMKTVPGMETGRIKADPGYLGQLLMNLVVNARDAMPNGGALTIATSNVKLDENFAPASDSDTSSDYVMLSVSDTGTGMTEEIKARIFEPFFTTKPKGKGTGLGLATCQSIVEQCGGRIELHSAMGRGTTFNIFFPRVEEPLEFDTKFIAAGPLPRGTETLLVVEDDSSVRQLARGILEGLGYKVLLAANGQDGLRVAREHQGPPVHLVITDIIMPLMGGITMAEWLKTTYPGLKILFTSGYTDDAITQHGGLNGGAEFLSKPYTPATLARKVRELLDGGTANRPAMTNTGLTE